MEIVKTLSMNYGLDNFTKEKCEDIEIEVPEKIVSDPGERTECIFEISWSCWSKYGKHRLYYKIGDNKGSDGYIDLDKKTADGKGKVGSAIYFGVKQGKIKL